MSANYSDFSVCIKKNKTNIRVFFDVILYGLGFSVVDELVAPNRTLAYFSVYKLVVKHCKDITICNKFYLMMRLISYYFYLAK